MHRRSFAYTLLEIMLVLGILSLGVYGVLKFFQRNTVQAATQKEQTQLAALVDGVQGMYAMTGAYTGVTAQQVAQQGVSGVDISGAQIVSEFGDALTIRPATVLVADDAFQVVYPKLSGTECVNLVPAVAGDAYAITIGPNTASVVSQTNVATGQIIDASVVATQCAALTAGGQVVLTYYKPKQGAGATAGAPTCSASCNPQTQTQTLACPGSEVGQVHQTRSGTCAGAPCPEVTWSAWTTTSSSCAVAPTPPVTPVTPVAPSAACSPSTAFQNLACPTGDAGRIVQQQQTTCVAGAPVAGPWTTVSDDCVPPSPVGGINPVTGCNPGVITGTEPCPAGEGGQITTVQNKTCSSAGSPVFGPVTPVSNTCQASCVATGTCCTVSAKSGPQQNVPCNAGQFGQIIDTTTEYSTCASATAIPVWGPAQITGTSGSCAACPGPAVASTACPAGYTGSATQTTTYTCPAGTTALPTPTITTNTSACTIATPECSGQGGPAMTVTPVDLKVDQVGDRGAVTGSYGKNGTQTVWTGSATAKITYNGSTQNVSMSCTAGSVIMSSIQGAECIGPMNDITVGGQSFSANITIIGPTPGVPSGNQGYWTAQVGVTQNGCLHWTTACNSLITTAYPANSADTNGKGTETPWPQPFSSVVIAQLPGSNTIYSGDGPDGNPWSYTCNMTGQPASATDPSTHVTVANPGAGKPTAPWSTIYNASAAFDENPSGTAYASWLALPCTAVGQSRMAYGNYAVVGSHEEELYFGQLCNVDPLQIYFGATGVPVSPTCPNSAKITPLGKPEVATPPPGCS